MSGQKRILIIIGTITAVAVIAVGGVFLYLQKSNSPAGGPVTGDQPNPNVSTSAKALADKQNSNTETADWKTYTNIEHGFEFKYPTDWLLKTYNGNPLVVLTSYQNEQLINQGKTAFSNFAVSYYKDANEVAGHLEQRLDLKGNEYKNLNDLFSDKGWWDTRKIGKIIVDGKDVYIATQSSGNNYVIFIENNGVYKLDFPSINPKIGISVTEKDIFSTFKFTK